MDDKHNWIKTEGYFLLGMEVPKEMDDADRIIAESKGNYEDENEALKPIYKYQPLVFDKTEVACYYQHLYIEGLTCIKFKGDSLTAAIVRIEFDMFDKMMR